MKKSTNLFQNKLPASSARLATKRAGGQANKGQSVIEVIIAVSIMVIIAATSVIAVLGSFSTTRLAEEETQASFFATEGIEAVQSIRNQNWGNLENGNHGLSNSGGIWSFSGTSDDPEGSGKFTRVIAVADAQRDGNGDLVSSGGTVDSDTKKVTSTITWDFTSGRSNTVEMAAYITNWQKGRASPGAGAPTILTCLAYCALVDYSSGTCRANTAQCTSNSETYKPQGDRYCTGGASVDTCCCGS